jgi:Mg-chelatase subunit ChlD
VRPATSNEATKLVRPSERNQPTISRANSSIEPNPNMNEKEKQRIIELVFVVDCTGSMQPYINSAKDHIQEISVRVKAECGTDKVRIAIVGYRDHPPQERSWLIKQSGFSTDTQDLVTFLRNLSANGGGDGPEALEAGLKAAKEQNWSRDATKIVVVITDAPPHGLGEAGDGFPQGAPTGVDPIQVVHDMAEAGIVIYSVGCTPALDFYKYGKSFLSAIATMTNGRAISLESASDLATVIVAAAIEGYEEDDLTADVSRQVAALRLAQPEISEQELHTHIYAKLKDSGMQMHELVDYEELETQFFDWEVVQWRSLSDAKEACTKMVPICAAPKIDSCFDSDEPPAYRSLGSFFGDDDSEVPAYRSCGVDVDASKTSKKSKASIALTKTEISKDKVKRLLKRATRV